MEKATLVVNIIATIVAIISCIQAIRAKNETKNVLKQIKKISINNYGDNNGVISNEVKGGVTIDNQK